MNDFQKELQQLKPYDEVQEYRERIQDSGYGFITTAGHGYLVVPMASGFSGRAKYICKYGFIGQLAIYLEEDSEAGEFLDSIKKV